MKLILVATDGSESSDRAIDFAVDLSRRFGAELLIVNVIGRFGLPEGVFTRFTPAQQFQLDEELDSLSMELLAKAKDRAVAGGDVTVRVESRKGEVFTTIMEIAHEQQADVIVVGKHGEGHVAGLLLGGVSQKLVSLSTRPVIVVP